VEGLNFLAIDPNECFDRTLCVAECPVEAVFAEADVPEGQKEYIELNARLAKKWPIISRKIDPPPDAEAWPR
jgi:ferredoxin